MSAPGLSYECGPATISFDRRGSLLDVRHAAQPGWAPVVDSGRPIARLGDRLIHWSDPVVTADSDEVEFAFVDAEIAVTVRHGFAAGWTVRVSLANLADTPVTVDDFGLTWRPSTGPAWAVAAGATASYAIPTPDGDGPVLGGLLTLGNVAGVTDERFDVGPVRLDGLGRYVVQWRWDWYATPIEFTADRQPQIPRSLFVEPEEPFAITADEDTAIVLSAGVSEERRAGQAELTCWRPGEFTVDLVSARGRTSFALVAAEAFDDLVGRAADQALAAAVNPSGIVPLADVHAALAVQHALEIGVLSDRDQAEDALDHFLARILDDDRADPLTIAFAAAEAIRTSADDPLDTARRWWEQHAAVQPGLGMAAAQLCLALVIRGHDAVPIIDRLARLGVDEGGRPPTPPAGRSSPALLASGPMPAAMALEQIILTARLGRPGDQALTMTRVVGGWLGAGLKGDAVRPRDVAEEAYLAAALRLTEETLGDRLDRWWGEGPRDVAARRLIRIRAAVADRPIGPALSWLILAARSADR